MLDNICSESRANYYLSSAFARAKFANINATTLYIYGYTDSNAFKELGLIKDGVASALTAVDGLNAWVADITGIGDIEIIAGYQGASSGTEFGTFIKDAYLMGGVGSLIAPTTPADRLLVYGDSIAVGYGSTHPVYQAWSVLLRPFIPVIVDAWSGRTLKLNGDTEAHRTTLAAKFAVGSPTRVWLAIGYNDYSHASIWSAADFGVAYADLLDKIHAALPDAILYAQTPIVSVTETANGYGNTLDDYRAAIASAQSTRSDFCTLVDGKAFLTTADIPDTIHPNTAGNVKYAAAVKAILGL
jgi:lysophospholipase L1-like esterase